MEDLPSSASGDETLLVCRVRERLVAFPIVGIVETMRPLSIQPFAGMPPFVLGVAQIRGGAVPVLDARALLGEPSNGSRATRFVTLKAGERVVAVAVDAVLEVRTLSQDSMKALPPLLGEAAADAVA